MKYPYYDNETNKEYMCENEYEFKIKTFTEARQCNFFDDEVIDYALSLKDEIIGELENNSSKSDKIRVEHIRWIEKHIDGIHDFLIQHKLEIPKVLEQHKSFTYQTGKRKIGRPKGKRNELTIKKYIWIRDKRQILVDNRKAHTIEEQARLIRSQLLKSKPDFWDERIYALITIIDIIKKQKWGD